MPPPNKFPPSVEPDTALAPVLAPSPVSLGGSPAGVVEPNEKPPVLGAAGVVDPKSEVAEVVAVEGAALVEAGGAPQLKLGALEAAVPLVPCALDPPRPVNNDCVLPAELVLLAELFPNPPKPPAPPLVPNMDGALVPVDFAAPNDEAPEALPKLNLGGSDMVVDVIERRSCECS